MMEKPSLGKTLANLFMGLTKGAPALSPYSDAFKRLGYTVHSLDSPVDIASGGRVRPDMILASPRAGNTLVLEWTEEGDPERKREQLSRYARIEGDDLSVSGAVPPGATGTHDVVLSVRREASGAFVGFVTGESLAFPVLGCAVAGDRVSITSDGSAFASDPTDDLFKGGIEVERVPMGYIPFSPEHAEYREVVAPTSAHTFALFIKGTGEFSLEEFCADCFDDVWPVMSTDAQRKVRKYVKQVLTLMSQFSFGRQPVIVRVRQNPSRYTLADVSKFSATRIRALRTKFESFNTFAANRPHPQGELGF